MTDLAPREAVRAPAPLDELFATEVPLDRLDLDAAVEMGASFAFDGRDGPGRGHAVVAIGEVARIEARGPDRWARAEVGAAAILARVRGPAAESARLVGGATFDRQGEVTFVLPRWTLIDDGARPRAIGITRSREAAGAATAAEISAIALAASTRDRRTQVTSASRVVDDGAVAFEDRVRAALAVIDAGGAEKIVVGRQVRVELDGPVDVASLWARLRAGEPGTVRLLWRWGDRALLAASPERLVVRNGERVLADALAGTMARGDDDAGARRELLASDKDRREHEVVAREIAASLASLGGAPRREQVPSVRSLRRVHHLSTEVRATFECAPHLLGLAAELHPTPAVAGSPREAALAFLRRHEPDRGWFTGTMGWLDREGDGELAVVLRAVLLSPGEARLFAGTGVVAGSVPSRELEETEAKLAAARDALGLGGGIRCWAIFTAPGPASS